MSDPVSSAAKAADNVFKNFSGFLRHVAPGYLFWIAYHYAIGRWPTKDEVWLEAATGLFLGILIGILTKTVVDAVFVWISICLIRKRHGYKRPGSTSIHEITCRLDEQRWLRRDTQHLGLKTIQHDLNVWGTGIVFLECAGVAILLAGVLATMAPTPAQATTAAARPLSAPAQPTSAPAHQTKHGSSAATEANPARHCLVAGFSILVISLWSNYRWSLREQRLDSAYQLSVSTAELDPYLSNSMRVDTDEPSRSSVTPTVHRPIIYRDCRP